MLHWWTRDWVQTGYSIKLVSCQTMQKDTQKTHKRILRALGLLPLRLDMAEVF